MKRIKFPLLTALLTMVLVFSQPIEAGSGSQTVEASGFGVVVTLLSVGIIAYIAPRLQKD